MTRLFSLSLLLAMAPAALAQVEAPISEVHSIFVLMQDETPVFQVDRQAQADRIRLFAGGTLVVSARELHVLIHIASDPISVSTSGPNAILLTPEFNTRALRAREVRDPASPSGTTQHRVHILVCTEEGEDGTCITWTRAVPFPDNGDPLTLEILDGASRGGGGVRTVDD